MTRPVPTSANNVWSEYEVQATASLSDRPLRTLKHGDAFAVFDSSGDCGTFAQTAEGLYFRDTRFLSRLQLLIEGKRPLLLTSAVHENKAALTVDLTNPDIWVSDNDKLARDTIFLSRTKFLRDNASFERILLRNFSSETRSLRLDLFFDSDFKDIFEIRGTKRKRRGKLRCKVRDRGTVMFEYDGLDAISRTTTLRFIPEPTRLSPDGATWNVSAAPYAQKSVFVIIQFNEDEEASSADAADYLRAYRNSLRERRLSTEHIAKISSSNELFNEVLARATSDVYTLVSHTDGGPYPYAGIPWFSTVFGRDGIITAMLMLWVDPSLTRGVLRTLAATQAAVTDPASDAQPGKILHELRHGEMANLGEVPFGRYYGSIDATPLFIMLAGMYLERTGDLAFIRDIWPNVTAALTWIDGFGDSDGDGFVEYSRAVESGLANQGWKDSWDAIVHDDGRLAEGPIALCEVQGYVFAAKRLAAKMALALGLRELSDDLSKQAKELQDRFESTFWCEDRGIYALALDGSKRRCQVYSSNALHTLFTKIAAPDRARRTARSMFDANGFSGWGVRTLSAGQPRYNPMSYHNGSVWPHDNALIALGLSYYGMSAEVLRIFSGMFDAARFQELRRLPELFCGFKRRDHLGPTPYPVACSPQAWASAAFFGIVAASLGLELLYEDNEIRLRNPALPRFVDELEIRDLQLGSSRLHLRVHRHGQDVTANIISRQGDAHVVLLK
jgi:glycogen debranching enzyme